MITKTGCRLFLCEALYPLTGPSSVIYFIHLFTDHVSAYSMPETVIAEVYALDLDQSSAPHYTTKYCVLVLFISQEEQLWLLSAGDSKK